MKDELQGKLVEILSSIQTAAGKASDFAMEQLPDIAQSYVLYGRVKTAGITAILLLVAIALFSIARWAYLNPWNNSHYSWDANKKRSDSNEAAIVAPFVVGVVCVVGAVVSFDLMVWFAPKVWLL